MKKMTLLIKLFFLCTVVLTSCKKGDRLCADDAAICSFIAKEEYNNTISVINQYLSRQNETLSDSEKLDQLRDWLKCKSCISDVKILCNSCIYTYPAQSEISIGFVVNGRLAEKILDVIMDKPLRVRSYHE